MIRIVVASDVDDVIGASDPVANAARFDLVPDTLDAVMRYLYVAPAIAGGAAMVGRFVNDGVNATAFTMDPDWSWSGQERVAVVTDAAAWAQHESHTPTETVIVGGLRIFTLLTPYASRLDRVVTDERIPGDLKYNKWRELDFRLDERDRFAGGVIEHWSRSV